MPPPPPPPAEHYTAAWDFAATNPGELSVNAGDIVTVTERQGPWWKARNAAGVTGWLPSNRVRPSEPSEIDNFNNGGSTSPAPAGASDGATESGSSAWIEPTLWLVYLRPDLKKRSIKEVVVNHLESKSGGGLIVRDQTTFTMDLASKTDPELRGTLRIGVSPDGERILILDFSAAPTGSHDAFRDVILKLEAAMRAKSLLLDQTGDPVGLESASVGSNASSAGSVGPILSIPGGRRKAAALSKSQPLDPRASAAAGASVGGSHTGKPLLPVSEDLSEEVRLRNQVVNEIYMTELDYVRDLQLVITGYIAPLRDLELMDAQGERSVFMNLPDLPALHLEFVKDLTAAIAKALGTGKDPAIGPCFARLSSKRFVETYKVFCSGQPSSDEHLRDLRKKSSKLRHFLDDPARLVSCRNLDLASLLIKPIQRLCKYPLLLRELLKYTPEAEGVGNAKRAVEEVLDAVNEHQRLADEAAAVKEILESVDGVGKLGGTESALDAPGRRFVLEGTLLELADGNGDDDLLASGVDTLRRKTLRRKKKKEAEEGEAEGGDEDGDEEGGSPVGAPRGSRESRYYLFSDLLLRCRKSPLSTKKWVLKNVMPLKQVLVEDLEDGKGSAVAFRFRISFIDNKKSKKWLIGVNNRYVKKQWMEALQGIISSALDEMAAEWAARARTTPGGSSARVLLASSSEVLAGRSRLKSRGAVPKSREVAGGASGPPAPRQRRRGPPPPIPTPRSSLAQTSPTAPATTSTGPTSPPTSGGSAALTAAAVRELSDGELERQLTAAGAAGQFEAAITLRDELSRRGLARPTLRRNSLEPQPSPRMVEVGKGEGRTPEGLKAEGGGGGGGNLVPPARGSRGIRRLSVGPARPLPTPTTASSGSSNPKIISRGSSRNSARSSRPLPVPAGSGRAQPQPGNSVQVDVKLTLSLDATVLSRDDSAVIAAIVAQLRGIEGVEGTGAKVVRTGSGGAVAVLGKVKSARKTG